MQPKNYTIEMKRGADFNLELQMLDDNNNPVDLTGYEWKAQIRERPETGLYYDFTISTVPEEGKVTMIMAHDMTEQILFNDGVYDLFYIKDAELRESLLQGNVSLIWKATKL